MWGLAILERACGCACGCIAARPVHCAAPPPATPSRLLPQVYRSSWLGAQGHDERKKLADAAARTKEAAARRGVMP